MGRIARLPTPPFEAHEQGLQPATSSSAARVCASQGDDGAAWRWCSRAEVVGDTLKQRILIHGPHLATRQRLSLKRSQRPTMVALIEFLHVCYSDLVIAGPRAT